MPLTDAQIRERYKDPRVGLKGLPAFIKELQGQASASQVRRALQADEAWALGARREQPKERRRVVVRGLDEVWCADLADVSAHAGENEGVRFLLVVVDVLSGFLWVQPIRTKTAVATKQALEAVLASGRKPKKLWTDEGSEWKGAFATLCASLGIHIYHTSNEGKAVVAERMIRTLRGRLGRLAQARGTWAYTDALQDLVKNINATVSRPIGMPPADVNAGNAEATARKRYADVDDPEGRTMRTARTLKARPKYALGDLVRISAIKSTFAKESTSNNWTAELFRVVGVQPGTPTLYTLADIDPSSGDDLKAGEALHGSFYEQELSEARPPADWRVVVKQRLPRGQVRVGWVGWLSASRPA